MFFFWYNAFGDMMKENLNLDTDIQFVKGVGPTKVVMLNKLGIYTVKDLIEFFPRMYEDRTKLYKITYNKNNPQINYNLRIILCN